MVKLGITDTLFRCNMKTTNAAQSETICISGKICCFQMCAVLELQISVEDQIRETSSTMAWLSHQVFITCI